MGGGGGGGMQILNGMAHYVITVQPLLSGNPWDFEKWLLLIEVGCLVEVQYKLDRNGSKHDFIDSV